MLALFVVVALLVTALAAGGQLKPLLSRLGYPSAGTSADSAHIESKVAVITPELSSSHADVNAIQPQAAAVAVAKAVEAESVSRPVEISPPLPASSAALTAVPASVTPAAGEEVKRLLATIDSLRGELAAMQQAQQQMTASMHDQQQMNLQVRLRWLNDPSSTLAQTQQTWEEISLLLDLSPQQRDEAQQMQRLAAQSVHQIQQWREALVKWSNTMNEPAYRDVLPKPDHPWLAWLVGQFHLYQAPSGEARKLDVLRADLLDAARHLSLELWPDKAAWQSLRAALLLQVEAMYKGRGEAVPDLGLPDDLDVLAQNIDRLHETALRWRSAGRGGI